MKTQNKDKFLGCLFGLAVGDAIGTTVEFQKRDTYEPVTDMIGGGVFNLQPGQWTDDTSMALCLAASLVENGFDPEDQIKRYIKWRDEGYMSCTGECFDIGNTVSAALFYYEANGGTNSPLTDDSNSGNGSIMRLAPVAMMYVDQPQDVLVDYCQRSSKTTHGSTKSVEACGYLGALLQCAIQGGTKDEILSLQLKCNVAEIQQMQQGLYQTNPRWVIESSGYVIHSLEAALWCFYHTDDFESAILLAANLGDDADTVAAITGQIAGAYYGVSNIPESWLEKLAWNNEIDDWCRELLMVEDI